MAATSREVELQGVGRELFGRPLSAAGRTGVRGVSANDEIPADGFINGIERRIG